MTDQNHHSSALAQTGNVHLGVTPYNFLTSLLVVLICGLAFSLAGLVIYFGSIRPVKIIDVVPVEMLELPGGSEDGTPDESLRVENEFPETNDASPAEIPSEVAEVAETIEKMLDVSDQSTELVEQQFDLGIQNSGKVGSARGTGARGLGKGPGKGGLSREQRWYVSFNDRLTADEYARQLESFGIELGAIEPDGTVSYLNRPATNPNVRKGPSAAETRLFMSWRGGNRKQLDQELLTRSGIPVRDDTLIVHFYPAQLEQSMLRLEQDFQHRPIESIRRTYFEVTQKDGKYQFIVIRQILNTTGK